MIERELLLSSRFIKEYENLFDYLWEEWGESITIKIFKELDASLRKLQLSPEHYPIFIKRKSIRRCVFSPQTSIYFRVSKNKIEIISLFDNRLNPKKLKLL